MLGENKKCENCDNVHDGKYGSGRFCSSICARGFSTKNKRSLINKKVSSKLTTLKLINCLNCNLEFKPNRKTNLYCSKTCSSKYQMTNELYKKQISDSCKKSGCGGIRKGAGRGKNGWYKGYWCDSSWELAYVIYNLDHNIKFKRNKQGFEYIYENKTHKYYPDFILEDGTYIEIKGRRKYINIDNKNKEKINQFKYNLILILEKDIKLYLNYVIDKYSKNYIQLYNNKENELPRPAS